MPEFISSTEAAGLLNYHVERIREMAREGRISGVQKGGRWWLFRESVESYQKAVEGMAKHDPRRGA